MKWIKRSDQEPPKDGSWILVKDKFDDYSACKWIEDGWSGPKFYHSCEEYGPAQNFDYWMPIISPEEQRQKEDHIEEEMRKPRSCEFYRD